MLLDDVNDESVKQNIKKINAQSWTMIEDGLRDSTWAKIKNGKVHVMSSYYDEDGFFSRHVFIGDTYEEAIKTDRVFYHFETFEPIDIDGEDW